jgi:hypothetical protein
MEATSMKNEIKFKEYMATLCELHDRTLSKLLTDLYWKVFEPFADEQCEKAFQEVIYSSKFFPKPVDFLEILNGKKANRATEAWLDVLNAMKRIGNYQSVKFSDPVIHSVVNSMGGWPQLCMIESKEEHWKQKEFERLYEVISAQDGKHPSYLPGTTEMENYRTGFERGPEIVRIGFDKQKIKMLQ